MSRDAIDILLAAKRVENLLRDNPEAKHFVVEIDRRMARLFLDFLHSLDPDMPPLPVCKALGPIVGDVVMNAKLNRLDELADKFGPLLMRLEQAVRDSEGRKGG